MNELLFLERREPDWKRLTFLCDRADASPAILKPEELKEFVRLYRKISADLAAARTRSSNVELINFLNDLCARAYSIIYRPKNRGFLASIGGLPALSARTVRKRWAAVLTSATIFIASAVVAYLCLAYAPDTRNLFVPREFEDAFEHWTHGEMERTTAQRGLAGTLGYSGNNPMASIMTGATAAGSFGVVTLQILFMNGGVVGALYHECEQVGRGGYLMVHIMPHGVTELSGLVLSGAAGFVMAGALIHPGRRRRGEALKEAGKDAIVILATSVVLMFIAAPIEGFFSFNADVPDSARLAVIVLSAVAWGTFWVGYRRRDDLAALPEEDKPLLTGLD